MSIGTAPLVDALARRVATLEARVEAAERALVAAGHGVEPHLTLDEAATLLGLARQTLYNRICQGLEGALRPTKPRSAWLIPVSGIREALERGRAEIPERRRRAS